MTFIQMAIEYFLPAEDTKQNNSFLRSSAFLRRTQSFFYYVLFGFFSTGGVFRSCLILELYCSSTMHAFIRPKLCCSSREENKVHGESQGSVLCGGHPHSERKREVLAAKPPEFPHQMQMGQEQMNMAKQLDCWLPDPLSPARISY